MPRDRSESRDRYKSSRRDKDESKDRHRPSRQDRDDSKDRHKSSRRHHRSRHSSRSPSRSPHGTSKAATLDTALGKKFVWKKKEEQGAKLGLSKQERRSRDLQRRKEAEHELAQLRKRRELREIEKQQRDQEMARKRREMEQEKLGDWERSEESFHLKQAKTRAELRVKNRRARPIDHLAVNLRLAYDDLLDDEAVMLGRLRVDVIEPGRMVDGLGVHECEELKDDVMAFLQLETDQRCAEFWQCLDSVINARMGELHEHRDAGVEREIRQMLDGKSAGELEQLASDVTAKLSGQAGAVDVDYWERVRVLLAEQRARRQLAQMHADVLARRLQRIDRAEGRAVEDRKRQQLKDLQRRILDEQGPEEEQANEEPAADSADALEAVLSQSQDPDEAVFSVEAQLPTRAYSWQDKHRPRKPRYYNRVHTGYEWNKYNQTHYDTDNPPPKVVQGYKFNLFYPDLLDKASAPTYRVEKDPENEDTAIIRFVAGPPYEDVAFRIVNREWELNRKRGFRNTFDRGVLQLHFRFKRHYYRR